MHIKVDQSGKIEVLTIGTVLAFSNEITATLLIPVSAKRETYQALKSRGIKPKSASSSGTWERRIDATLLLWQPTGASVSQTKR
jgi:hypothetical protein